MSINSNYLCKTCSRLCCKESLITSALRRAIIFAWIIMLGVFIECFGEILLLFLLFNCSITCLICGFTSSF